MIVAAEPRAGGTKFCLDLAELTGKQYIGERYGVHLQGYNNQPTWKSQYHETQEQPVISIDEFFGEHSDKIVLCNRHDILFACQQADYFIMRKSTIDMCLSGANYAKGAGIPPHIFLQTGRLSDLLEIKYVLASYVKYACESVTWYEDQSFARPVNTDKLSASEIQMIRDYYLGWAENGFEKNIKELLTFTQ